MDLKIPLPAVSKDQNDAVKRIYRIYNSAQDPVHVKSWPAEQRMEINAFIRKSQPKGTKHGNEKYTTNKFQYIVRQEQQCNKCKKHMQHMQQVPYLRNVLLQKALNRSLTIANATKSLRNADNTTETMPVQSYYCTYICCKHVPTWTMPYLPCMYIRGSVRVKSF